MLLGVGAVSINGRSADGCTTIDTPDSAQTGASGHFVNDDGIVELVPFYNPLAFVAAKIHAHIPSTLNPAGKVTPWI